MAGSKFPKILISLVVILLVGAGAAALKSMLAHPGGENPAEPVTTAGTAAGQAEPISFADPNLEACVRTATGKASGPFEAGKLAALTSLNAGNSNIVNLSGIENLPNLSTLYLRNNQIEDLSPLKELKSLRILALNQNRVTSLEPLSELTGLEHLYLQHNRIEKVRPVQNLSNLRELFLDDNPIGDLSPLYRLPQTCTLYWQKALIAPGELADLFVPSEACYSSDSVLAGDLNCDGTLTRADAVLLEKYLARRVFLPALSLLAADMDNRLGIQENDLQLLNARIANSGGRGESEESKANGINGESALRKMPREISGLCCNEANIVFDPQLDTQLSVQINISAQYKQGPYLPVIADQVACAGKYVAAETSGLITIDKELRQAATVDFTYQGRTLTVYITPVSDSSRINVLAVVENRGELDQVLGRIYYQTGVPITDTTYNAPNLKISTELIQQITRSQNSLDDLQRYLDAYLTRQAADPGAIDEYTQAMRPLSFLSWFYTPDYYYGALIGVEDNHKETPPQSQLVEQNLQGVINEIIGPEMTEEEKVFAVRQWIAANVRYDNDLQRYTAYKGLFDDNGQFGKGRTTCQGYAAIVYKMLKLAGLEAKYIYADTAGGGHALNMVKINGSWYFIDFTSVTEQAALSALTFYAANELLAPGSYYRSVNDIYQRPVPATPEQSYSYIP